MTKNKRLGVSIFLVLLTIFLVISVIFTFSISYMFSSKELSGRLFGWYIYIMNDSSMEPEISEKSAVIADDESISVLVENNVILFKNGSREDVMRIRQVVHNTDGTIYQVSPDATPQELTEVKKENVIAKCTTEGHNLGVFISFLSSLPGIIVFMILPCIGILVLLITKILSMKKSGQPETMPPYNEDNFGYDDDDDDDEFLGFGGKNMRSSPLFDPESDINPGEDFEKKKSSIYNNFRRKPGAAPIRQSRTKQDAAPKAAVEKFKAAVDEKPHAPVSRKSTLIPENQNPVRDEQLDAIKTALINQDMGIDSYPSPENPGEDKTVAFRPVKNDTDYIKKPDIIQTSKAKKTASNTKADRPVSKPAVPQASNKSENINSIDDLIKALEEEKKKL